jgi:DnaD/phage-associated family protein
MEDIVASQHRRYGRRRGDSVQNQAAAQVVAPVAPAPAPVKTAKAATTDVSNLLFIAEQYFGRTLTSTEMQTICYIHDDLAFSDDLLDYLMQYCVDNHKKDFRYMEKVAINWNQQGIKTPKQARAEIFKHDSDFIAIMKALGMENSPTEKETNFILKWRGELGFSMDIILEACDRTVMATQKGRLKYCDAILRSWHEKKVKTREDIAKLDANFTADLAKKRSKASISSIDTKLRLSESSIRSGVSQNRFNQFQQNTYDFAELEKKLLDN